MIFMLPFMTNDSHTIDVPTSSIYTKKIPCTFDLLLPGLHLQYIIFIKASNFCIILNMHFMVELIFLDSYEQEI